MDVQKLRKLIATNISLDVNDDYEQEKCWDEMTKILASDICGAIKYFKEESTDEELYWLGAVFEDVAEKTQNKEFIQILRDRLDKVLIEKYDQQAFKSSHMRKNVDYYEYVRSVNSDIEFAEAAIIDNA